MARSSRQSLDELIDRSIRGADVSGWREQVEKTLADQRPLSNSCELALNPLLSMLERHPVIKERIVAAGGDYYGILEDFENPKHRALSDALVKLDSDTAAALGAWKRGCMRRRPEQD